MYAGPGSQPRRPPPRQRTSSSGRLREPRAEASDGRWLVCGACDGGSKGGFTAGAAGRRRRGVQELEQSGHAHKNCSQEIGFEDERVESQPLTPEHSGVLISNSNRAVARACDKEVVLSQLRHQEFGNFYTYTSWHLRGKEETCACPSDLQNIFCPFLKLGQAE
jgi:hypothetical protein